MNEQESNGERPQGAQYHGNLINKMDVVSVKTLRRK